RRRVYYPLSRFPLAARSRAMSPVLDNYNRCIEPLRTARRNLLNYAEILDKACRRFADWKAVSTIGAAVPREFRPTMFLAQLAGWPSEDELGKAYRAWEQAQDAFCRAYDRLSPSEKQTPPPPYRVRIAD